MYSEYKNKIGTEERGTKEERNAALLIDDAVRSRLWRNWRAIGDRRKLTISAERSIVFLFACVSVSINFQEENRCRPSRITRPMSLGRPHEWNSSFLVKKKGPRREEENDGGTTEGKEQDEKRSPDRPYEASRGFHEDIEGTKDRRRIRHVQPMHSKYLTVGRSLAVREEEESPSKIESFIWKVGSLRSWEPT